MANRANLASFSVFSIVGAFCGWSSAEDSSRIHLGVETSIVNSTSADGTLSASGGSSTGTNNKIVANSTEYGLPGTPALSLGVMLGEHVDLGTRLYYESSTTKLGLESTAAEVETSGYQINPYIAYLGGDSSDSARFTIGVAAGLGSGTSKTTIPTSASGSATSASSETKTGTFQYGAFLGLRAFPSQWASFDPMVMLMKTSMTSEPSGGVETDLSGMSLMLNVGFSLWFGGKPASSAAMPSGPAKAPGAAPTPGEPPAVVPAATTTDPPQYATTAPAERTDRITIPLGDAGAMTLILKDEDSERSFLLVLRESQSGSSLSTCQQVTLHAGIEEEILLDVAPGMAATAGTRVPILKGFLTTEQLSTLTRAPRASATAEPDHWLGVCGRQWKLVEGERDRLKRFVGSLPAMKPAAE